MLVLWMVNEYRLRRVAFTGAGLRAKLLVPLKADRGRLAGKPTMTYLIAYIWLLWYYKPENVYDTLSNNLWTMTQPSRATHLSLFPSAILMGYLEGINVFCVSWERWRWLQAAHQ